jgi:hypothetical protein
MAAAEWFKKGFEVVDAFPELKRQNRFWLNVAQEKKVIFLDDAPFTFYEHALTLNGDFRNWFTCRKNLNQPCPLCEAKLPIYYIGLLTVLDLTEFSDKKTGVMRKNEVRLFAAKVKALKILKKQAEKGRLKNGLYTVSRIDEKSGRSGDFFDFDQTVNPLTYNPDAKVLVYEEVCKPLEYDQLKTLAGLAEPDKFAKASGAATSSFSRPAGAGSGAGSEAGPDSEDDQPF